MQDVSWTYLSRSEDVQDVNLVSLRINYPQYFFLRNAENISMQIVNLVFPKSIWFKLSFELAHSTLSHANFINLLSP